MQNRKAWIKSNNPCSGPENAWKLGAGAALCRHETTKPCGLHETDWRALPKSGMARRNALTAAPRRSRPRVTHPSDVTASTPNCRANEAVNRDKILAPLI
jgi:hypothetical protein